MEDILKNIRYFDYNLYNKGRWDILGKECNSLIKRWLNEKKSAQKVELASQFIVFLIRVSFEQQIGKSGEIKKRLNILEESLKYFEKSLTVAIAGIGKKFYRDHLNHMVRVALILNAIMNECEVYGPIDKSSLIMLSTAGAVHDLAYCLSEAREMFSALGKRLGRVFSTIDIPEILPIFKVGLIYEYLKLLKLESYVWKNPSQLLIEIDKPNHAIVSACEFLSFAKPELCTKQLIGAAQAIALHDTNMRAVVTDEDDGFHPYPDWAPLLILADELQDWGREAGTIGEIDLVDLGPKFLSHNSIIAEFRYISNNSRVLSIFEAKFENLSRIHIHKSCDISLIFPI